MDALICINGSFPIYDMEVCALKVADFSALDFFSSAFAQFRMELYLFLLPSDRFRPLRNLCVVADHFKYDHFLLPHTPARRVSSNPLPRLGDFCHCAKCLDLVP